MGQTEFKEFENYNSIHNMQLSEKARLLYMLSFSNKDLVSHLHYT